MACKTLEEARFARVDAEIVELHLRLGPCQRSRPVVSGDIPMLVNEIEGGRTRWRHQSPEADTHDGARGNAHAMAQDEDRIKHRANRVRERSTVDDRERAPGAAAATEETGPVGLDLRLPHGLAVDNGEVRGPDLRLARRAPSSRRQDGARISEIFGLH